MVSNMLSCRIGSYGKFALYSYEHLSEIGVRNIECPIPKGRAEKENLREILEDFDLNVASFQVNFDPLKANIFSDQVDHVVDTAGYFNTKVIFSSIKAPDWEKRREKLFSQLRILGDTFQQNGLRLCMETHPNLVTNGTVGRQTMEEINHPAIKINFDTANMYYYNEDIDLLEELDMILDWVGSVHLKDTSGEFKTWNFPTLGVGIVDFKAVVDKLTGIGFKGPYTMEIEGIKGEELDLNQTKKRISNSVAYINPILEDSS